MALPKRSSPLAQSESTRELKDRVILSLNKLSDRDTHAIAATELESIARSLSRDSLSPFLACLFHTDSSDKPPVRKQTVRLLGVLATGHGDSLSPFLPKMLSGLLRRLRDPDTVVRSACVEAVSLMASQITKPPFSAFLKPLMEALVHEQDQSSQIGSALCLAKAIEASPDPGRAQLQRHLPRMVKLLRSESFKAKPALLSLIGCIVGVGGGLGDGVLGALVHCVVEFLGSEDWAARRAAAEALAKLGVAERELLSEFKASCLACFEARRFDKVKVVRETMNQMIEVWKDVPDVCEEVSTAPLQSRSSSSRDTSDSRFPPGSRSPGSIICEMPQNRRIGIPTSRSPQPDSSFVTTARKRSPCKSSDRKSSSAWSCKLDHKKHTDWKIEIVVPHGPSCEEDFEGSNGGVLELEENDNIQCPKPQPRHALFNGNNSKVPKFGGMRARSHVVPFHEESSESTVDSSSDVDDFYGNHKDNEDLSLIRKQLVQIENQQLSLFELLQRFIGSSQNGIRSLETRVHGLELALDEILYDLAMSTGRMSNTDDGNTCCKLPGTEFLSCKFRRKTDGHYTTSRLPSPMGTPPLFPTHNISDKDGCDDVFKLQKQRFQQNIEGGGLVINNPLAEICTDSSSSHNICSHRMLVDIIQDEGRKQTCHGNGLDRALHSAGISSVDNIGRSCA